MTKRPALFAGFAVTAIVGGLLYSTTPVPAMPSTDGAPSVKFGSPGATINSAPCLLGPYVFLNGERPNIPDCTSERIREAAKRLGN